MTEREFFVGTDVPRVPRETLERLRAYGACVAGDAMRGFNAMDSRIRALGAEAWTAVSGRRCAACWRHPAPSPPFSRRSPWMGRRPWSWRR